MKYHYREGVTGKKSGRRASPFLLVLALLLFGVGGYLLVNVFAPNISMIASPGPTTTEKLKTTAAKANENRLYIPSINVDVKVVEIKDYPSETIALEQGAIHRAPDNGNPSEGGNFVLAAHRFNLGLTPMETMAKSPFYNIDKLKTGEQIFVDWKGTRYAYEIAKKYPVPATAIEIEKRTEQPTLTVYSCDLAGPEAGREVVEAKPIGTVTVKDGRQVIERG